MKTGGLHARVAEIVEELHAVNPQHHRQRVGPSALASLGVEEPTPEKAGGRMRASRLCQGLSPSIRSRNSSLRVFRFLTWYSKSENVGWSINFRPSTGIRFCKL